MHMAIQLSVNIHELIYTMIDIDFWWVCRQLISDTYHIWPINEYYTVPQVTITEFVAVGQVGNKLA